MIQFIYASRYEVSIPCMMHEPILADVTISKVKDLRLKERDHFPSFTTLALQAAQQMMIESDGPLNIRQVCVEPSLVICSILKPLPDRRSAGRFLVRMLANTVAVHFLGYQVALVRRGQLRGAEHPPGPSCQSDDPVPKGARESNHYLHLRSCYLHSLAILHQIPTNRGRSQIWTN